MYSRGGDEPTAPSPLTLAEIPVDGARAYQWLEKVCDLGSRVSGSPGMVQQQQMLAQHFQQLGGTVEEQSWTERHPLDGSPVKLTNLIVRWHPDRKDRVLLCAHYDTRPYPDRDPHPSRRRDLFVGANDGGSGVAVLAELGHHMESVSGVGVDFVFFDAEELVYDDNRDKYFLGSERFARDYVANPPPTPISLRCAAGHGRRRQSADLPRGKQRELARLQAIGRRYLAHGPSTRCARVYCQTALYDSG